MSAKNHNRLKTYLIVFAIFQLAFLLFSLLGDIYIEHGPSTFFQGVIRFINFPVPLFICLIIAVLCVACIFYMFQYQQGRIAEYEEEAKDNARTLMNSYRQLNEMSLKRDLRDVMKKFTKNEPYVWAVQLYESSIKMLKQDGKNKTMVQINHVEGFVTEGVNLNALLQQYYVFDADVYKEFQLAQYRLAQNDLDFILKFIHKYRQYLSLKVDAYTTHDSIIYAFLRLSVEILESSGLIGKHTAFFLDPDQKRKLVQLERTGILRGMQVDHFYTFEHQGDGDKKGRLYITKPATIKGIPHIFLLTVNPDILYEEQSKYQLTQLTKDFNELLTNDLKEHVVSSYNDDKILGIWGNIL
ncbi:hypothetical protein [Brevibacillus marinus]|uniref:hypothetical protein n=1 Tax=Brevibacillus marinus TaxID=2496837 RepID=UPI000F8314AD|nr:hypothetical protein [Brevibacillus marinus]